MQRLTARDHLIAARDHDLYDVPHLYRVEGPSDRFLIHVDCDEARARPPVAFEHLPDSFLLGSCETCRDGQHQPRHDHLIEDVDRLVNVAALALDLCGVASELLNGNAAKSIDLTSAEEGEEELHELITQYASTGYYLRRTLLNDGLSWAEKDASKDVDNPNSIRAHVVDLSADLTLQWLRLCSRAPIRRHLAGTTPGERRVRVVPNRQPQRGLDSTRQDPRDAALQLEARTLLSTPGWELIEWDTNLNEWATTEQVGMSPDQAIAEAEELTLLQLEQVLRLYTRQTWTAGPTLQELVDAVRAASA